MQSENFLKKSSARRVAPLQSGVRYVVQPLAGHQFGEEAVRGDQLVIGPVLDDLSLVEHEDAVALSDGGQAVGDDNAGALQPVQ